MSSTTSTATPPSSGRRVRVPTTVHMARIPSKVRTQLLKSQLQPLPWQNKQICDHFITGNCPYVPCRFAHQCLLCMDDLVGQCTVAQCKYVHLLVTPDAECTDDRVIIVRRGQLLPPQTTLPASGQFIVPPHAFNLPAHATTPPAIGASVSTDSFEGQFFGTASGYPRLTLGYPGVPQPRLANMESPGSDEVYHGHFPSPTGSPYPVASNYSPAPSSLESESEGRFMYAYPTAVASRRSTPSPQSPAAHATQYTQQMPNSALNTGYAMTDCQLPCCAGRRSSYPRVVPPSPPMAPHQNYASPPPAMPASPIAHVAPTPQQFQPAGTFQHSPYSICTGGYDVPSYPQQVKTELPKSEYPPSPSSSSSDSDGSANPWITQRPPPIPSPRLRGQYRSGVPPLDYGVSGRDTTSKAF